MSKVLQGVPIDPKITPSSGNVFKDLGFGEEEAEHLRIRSTLMIAVRQVIEVRALTQAEAARLFGVTQPRISNLVRGRIDLFSIDTLVDMLARAGIHVDVVVSPARQGAA
jgi:predicted XRE-type DNA-binding protein